MSTFQERLEQELCDLGIKICKLEDFLDTEKFNDLDSTSQLLLKAQLNVMTGYADILNLRIDHLEEIDK